MKNILIIACCLALISGCDFKKKETTFEGVPSAKKDYVRMGIDYLNKSDVQRAIQSFDMAIRQNPMNVDNYMILGEVYLRLKEYTRAVDTFGAALRVAPSDGEALYFLALSKALKSKIEKTPELSEKSYAEAIQAAQKSVEVFMNTREEEKFRRAVTLLRNLTERTEIDSEAAVPSRTIKTPNPAM